MKIYNFLGYAFFVIFLLISACSSGEDPIEPTIPLPEVVKSEINIDSGLIKNGLSFSSDKGEQTISFSTNENWTLSIANTISGETWCTASATSGGNGSASVKFSVAENSSYDERSVSVTIQSGTATITFIISQKVADALLVTKDRYEIGKEGGTIDIEVKANVEYQMEIAEKDKDWIQDTSRGLTTCKHTVSIAANKETQQREGEIYFKSGEKTETVKIYQVGSSAVILLSKKEYTVSDKGETIIVDIKSNVEFGVKMPNADWIVDEASSRGLSSHSLKYMIKANNGYDNRSASIVFYDKNSDLKESVKIIQSQKDAIILSQKEYEVKAEGETIDVQLNTNIDYLIEIEESAKTWIAYCTSRGLTTDKVSFTISANEGSEKREGKIYIKSKDSKIEEKITIYQEGKQQEETNGIPYLSFIADAAQTLSLSKAVATLEYSFDDKTWNELSTNTVEFGGSKGVLLLRGKSAKGTVTDLYNDYANIRFGNNVKVECKGDIRTLIDYEKYETVDTKNARFSYLFANCTSLVSAPSLPMKALAYDCYQNMFAGCTSLKIAPELPATSLDLSCYRNMFYGCTSLTDVPELPATTLANHCYDSMFYGCTSLTKAPKLPAMVMVSNCYDSMFYNCTSLTEAPTLPSTTLDMYCYRGMFAGCTNLTSAPQLPAQTLAMACYESMFEGCSKLTKAPQLPADKATQNGYAYMFSGCTSLTTAPNLPATVLSKACYEGMFEGCTSLTTAPSILPVMKLEESCYENMFKGCTSLTKSPELPATTMIRNCYRAMFEGCTSLTIAPILPATTLINYCYSSMFSGCSKLNNITMLATTTDLFSLKDWVKGVASTGTFIKDKDMNSLSKGSSGIPEGWTVKNYGESNKSLTITLTEAGTLGNYLTDAYKKDIEELKIIGDINGTDIQLIRDITEVDSSGNPTENTGALIKLDLSEANIVSGGNPYKAIRPDQKISTQNNVVSAGMFGYTYLKTIILPDNITEIGDRAFEVVLNMENFVIPKSVTKLGHGAFNTCRNLKAITIPESVVEIGSNAFNECAFTAITLPSKLKVINQYTFMLCKNLKKVNLPDGLKEIELHAFLHCDNLIEVHCKALTPPTLNSSDDPFKGCIIYVPALAVDNYKNDAAWGKYNIVSEE